jgi:hypothetical protein
VISDPMYGKIALMYNLAGKDISIKVKSFGSEV